MKISKGGSKGGSKIALELSEDEARSLCEDLCDVSVSRSSDPKLLLAIVKGFRENLKPPVTPAEVADAVKEAAAGLRYEDDKADMLVLSKVIRAGNRPLATSIAQNMDTAIRDAVPEVAWPFCGLRALR